MMEMSRAGEGVHSPNNGLDHREAREPLRLVGMIHKVQPTITKRVKDKSRKRGEVALRSVKWN